MDLETLKKKMDEERYINYETLINIYYARRNHKLPEWHTYCDWIAALPYADHWITNLK